MAEEKILLIEENATRAEGIALVLEKLGHYRLTHTPTIEGAMQQLKAGPFDLIMTNITIEKPLDGVKLAQLILMRRGKSQRPPVVIITQERDRDVVRQCVQAGVVDYIVSFDPPYLIQRVRKILEQRRGLNEDEMRQGIIAALEKVLALPTISPVYTKIQTMLRSRESSAEDVARVVSLDQSITANLLRLSNSALFGFSHQIQSVKEAVALLGFKAVQTAIATVSTFEALGRVESKRFNRRAFWEHSIGCGAVARVLAGKLKMGGKVFIDTPKQFWIYPFAKLVSRALYTKMIKGTVSTAHLQIWSKKSFEMVVSESGLSINKYEELSEYTMPSEFYMNNMGITNPLLRLAGRLFYGNAKWLAKNKRNG